MKRPHKIPPLVVRLGRALELVTQEGDRQTFWDEVDGFQMWTDPNAVDRAPGYARLFLVAGDDPDGDGDDFADMDEALATYAEWHRRDATNVTEVVDLPDRFGTTPIGRAIRLDYASDKWGREGREVEYTHDFFERGGSPPLVYVDNRETPRAFLLVGGSMTITARGIE